jgi:hypothetical protein
VTGLYQKGGELNESLFSLGACEFDLVWSSLTTLFGKGQLSLSLSRSLSLSLALPLLVADRWSGYVCVLVRFRLGTFILILVSVLCGIPDCV